MVAGTTIGADVSRMLDEASLFVCCNWQRRGFAFEDGSSEHNDATGSASIQDCNCHKRPRGPNRLTISGQTSEERFTISYKWLHTYRVVWSNWWVWQSNLIWDLQEGSCNSCPGKVLYFSVLHEPTQLSTQNMYNMPTMQPPSSEHQWV